VTVLLIHSPLLGPLSWEAVAQRLPDAVVPDLRPALVPPYYASLSAAACAELQGADAVTVIAHSRGGPLVPAIAAILGPAVTAVVLVDARLPHPGRTWLSTLAPGQAERLQALVQDGLLPPWDTWFPDTPPTDLGPIPRVPWEMLLEPAPDLALPAVPRRYVQLSAPYGDTAERAAAEGFEVVRADAGHLAPMTAPDLVRRLCLEIRHYGE
jgi:pimeloyl-ACP methyl ester carboxylesterase